MTPDRFEELADAYGGEVARWPQAVREPAALLMTAEPAFTSAVLERAQALDAALNDFAFKPASAALTKRIVAQAPQARAQRGWRRWVMPAGLGAGLAAACAAGVLVGAQVGPSLQSGDTAAASTVADLDVSGLSEDV